MVYKYLLFICRNRSTILAGLGGVRVARFDKLKIKDLKDYLYHSNIHDAKIKALNYNTEQGVLAITALNPIYNLRMELIFEEVKSFLFTRDNKLGSRETIISLTVEEDGSYLENCTQICSDEREDFLYLLFQMFSGDELHIVSKAVFIKDEM